MRRSTQAAEHGMWGDPAERAGGAFQGYRPDAAGSQDGSDDWLAQTIESQIIPRLMLVHRAAENEAGIRSGEGRWGSGFAKEAPTGEEAVELARLVMGHDPSVARVLVDEVRHRGVPKDTLLLDLMAPAARHLGRLWEEDECDFLDVTLGLAGLERLVRELAATVDCDEVAPANGRRVLLMPVPGEQHCFGLTVLDDFFMRAGWDVVRERPDDVGVAACAVAAERFDLVGLSISCDIHADGLQRIVEAVRNASCNPTLSVLVGGRYVADNPAAALVAGADATARDGRSAVDIANGLLDERILPVAGGMHGTTIRSVDG